MASTGNVFPQTGENNAGIGATAWTNPGNVVSDNTTDATCNAAASSQYLVARNFGFTIPADATIGGITVRVEASSGSYQAATMPAGVGDAPGSQRVRTLMNTGVRATVSYRTYQDMDALKATVAASGLTLIDTSTLDDNGRVVSDVIVGAAQ